jgi:hypothetical protein
MQCPTLGLDVAKNVFQLHGVDEREQVVQKCASRSKLRETLAQILRVSWDGGAWQYAIPGTEVSEDAVGEIYLAHLFPGEIYKIVPRT